MIKIKCIKELITDNTKYIPYCESDEVVAHLLSLPSTKFFTKGKIYDVTIVNNEWRVKDDTCNNNVPYNHIVLSESTKEKNWFAEHFEVIETE